MGFIALALLAALILGFLARRVMIPSAVHYIAYRPPDQPQGVKETDQPASQQDSGGDSSAGSIKSNSTAHGGSEQLTPRDRSELDAIIKRKSK